MRGELTKIVRSQYFWLSLIVLIGFLARIYKIDNPLADWHSWRQADTAAVARNFYKEGFNPTVPKYDDMSPAGGSMPNPGRYRLVEFPIYNSLVYFTYLLNGGVDERLARLVSAFISLGSVVLLFLVVKKYWGIFPAFVSALLLSILPFNVYFSRTTLPEPTLVFLSLGALYFTDRWIRERGKWLFLTSVVFASSALLVKPVAIFYLLPLIYSYLRKEGCLFPVKGRYLLWAALVLLPFISWRLWIGQHPEGIPPFWWLLDGDGIRFKPAFWKWMIGERLGGEILSVAGFALFTVGFLVRKTASEGELLHLTLLSSLAFLVIFATGNVRHDYYQTFVIPPLVAFVARGFVILVKGSTNLISRIWTIPLAFLLLFLTIYLDWKEVAGMYQINNYAIVEAGKMADKVLPKNAVVVAPYSGDTAFLYQINRPGWPYVTYPIPELIKKYGATHYVSVNYDDQTNWVIRNYKVIFQNPKFVIVDLTK